MITIVHAVNPVRAPETSDLSIAQPVTFESMRVAKEFALGVTDVRQVSVQFPEDRAVVPSFMEQTDDLDRSVLDLRTFDQPRKLPLLEDILSRLKAVARGADLGIYTNVDIALMPGFYTAIAEIYRRGHDAFVINRRTIPGHFDDPRDLPLMYAEVGDSHPGRDCFVFEISALHQYDVGDVAVGAGHVGRVLFWNLVLTSNHFEWFQDFHLTFHIGNDRVWKDPRFAAYSTFNLEQAKAVEARLRSRYGPLEEVPGLERHLVPR